MGPVTPHAPHSYQFRLKPLKSSKLKASESDARRAATASKAWIGLPVSEAIEFLIGEGPGCPTQVHYQYHGGFPASSDFIQSQQSLQVHRVMPGVCCLWDAVPFLPLGLCWGYSCQLCNMAGGSGGLTQCLFTAAARHGTIANQTQVCRLANSSTHMCKV